MRKAGTIKILFERFDKRLKSDEEKETVKRRNIPEDWQKRSRKLVQKDPDDRWTVKFSRAKKSINPCAKQITYEMDTWTPPLT